MTIDETTTSLPEHFRGQIYGADAEIRPLAGPFAATLQGAVAEIQHRRGAEVEGG